MDFFRSSLAFFFFALLFSSLHSKANAQEEEEQDSDEQVDLSYVTCGSIIKLKHVATGVRLHSHQVTYGSGSGQQSVTGQPNADDPNSMWIVRAQSGKKCKTGALLWNGDSIRLQHLTTNKNLHSHLHKSPLTGQQEVSCFGEEGSGDSGDNWKIVTTSGDVWKRGDSVKLIHVDTSKYLSSNKSKFSNPIPGQQEICGISQDNADVQWIADEGIYFPGLK